MRLVVLDHSALLVPASSQFSLPRVGSSACVIGEPSLEPHLDAGIQSVSRSGILALKIYETAASPACLARAVSFLCFRMLV